MQKNLEPQKIITRRENGTKKVSTLIPGPTMTQQQFKDQADVNQIIAQYIKTGSVTHVRNATQGVYLDLTSLPDLHEAQNIIIKANSAFMDIPAHIRNRFGNDPKLLVDFLSNPSNLEEAVSLGLAVKPKDPIPDPTLLAVNNLASELKKSNLKPKKETQES